MKIKGTLISMFPLLMILLWNCNKNRSVAIAPYYDEANMLELKVDSIMFPPEVLMFPIRLKFTNKTNKKIAMLFKPDVNKEFNKNMIFISADNDTIRFSFLDSLIIFNEYSKTSFTVHGMYTSNQLFGKGGFEVLKKNLQKGKLIYLGNTKSNEPIKITEQSSPKITKALLQIDTLFIPYRLEASTQKTDFVYSFLQGSLVLVTQKLAINNKR